MKKMLIVEDNQDMRKGLTDFFNREGFLVTDVSSCEEGIDAVDENKFDVCIIDINLPGKSGYELIEYIREEGNKMPLLAMTARDSIDDKLKGFELGLTDYIVKPFDRKEILARVDARLGNSKIKSSNVIKTTNFVISPENFSFSKNNKTIELTKTEFRMMQLLMSNHNSIVTIEDIINFVWGEHPDMVNPPIRIHIANLRGKIHDKDFTIIRTIPAVGYIFNDEHNEAKND